MPNRAYALIIVFCSSLQLCAQKAFKVMTYNCENVFDCRHEPGKEDSDFTPEGSYKWTEYKLWKKLSYISKVVLSVADERPVDVIALCEVENDTVLTRLLTRTPLRNIGYKYVITDSPNERGVNVALLYSPFTFHVFETRDICFSDVILTRNALRVSGTVNSGDTIDIYALHLPSRLGGWEANNARKKIGQRLMSDIDSLVSHRASPYVVVMGDFNSSGGESLLRKVFKVSASNNVERHLPSSLYELPVRGEGTYKYHGVWDSLDHIFLSGNFMNRDKNVCASDSAYITSHDFMLEDDDSYGGKKPWRTYLGPKYVGGISDHLPVHVVLKIREE